MNILKLEKMNKVKRKKREMMQILMSILLIVMLTGFISFLSGFLTGRCYERRNIQNFMEYYASLSNIEK